MNKKNRTPYKKFQIEEVYSFSPFMWFFIDAKWKVLNVIPCGKGLICCSKYGIVFYCFIVIFVSVCFSFILFCIYSSKTIFNKVKKNNINPCLINWFLQLILTME